MRKHAAAAEEKRYLELRTVLILIWMHRYCLPAKLERRAAHPGAFFVARAARFIGAIWEDSPKRISESR